MDRTRGAWEIGFGFNNPSYRGGDPERFRDEAKGLGRVALLGQFFSMEQLKRLWPRVLCPGGSVARYMRHGLLLPYLQVNGGPISASKHELGPDFATSITR